MTDEITQNDCQGEQMYSAEIPINIELGSAGLYYGTSPQMKGLLVTGHTIREVMDRVPAAIAEMRAVAAMGAELSRLQTENAEAREIIGKLTEKWVKYHRLFEGVSDNEAPRHDIEILDVDLATLRRARAFITKGKTDDAA